jgi:hypothetical protein
MQLLCAALIIREILADQAMSASVIQGRQNIWGKK